MLHGSAEPLTQQHASYHLLHGLIYVNFCDITKVGYKKKIPNLVNHSRWPPCGVSWVSLFHFANGLVNGLVNGLENGVANDQDTFGIKL